MNDNYIEIKEQRKGTFTKGLITLAIAVISLTVALFPHISHSVKNPVVFYAIGGVAFAASITVFVMILYKECNPGNALILNGNGFTDLKNIGEDIEIEWTNISSVKMLGKGNLPFLGIVLENSDIVMSRMKKSASDKMRKNIEDGLPAIMISQNDVRIPIRDLRDICIKFVRESRLLQKDTPKKTRTNPFSTDDVLRAFGKLPKEKTEEKVVEEKTIEENTAPAPEPISNEAFYDTIYGMAVESKEPIATIEDSDDDEKYEGPYETDPVTITDDDEASVGSDEMPAELKEILSRARSSKITELEKILAEDDIPYSLSKESGKTVEKKDSFINNGTVGVQKNHSVNIAKPDLNVPENIYQESAEKESEKEFGDNLDKMLKNAFKIAEESDNNSISDRDRVKFDPNAVYPDLVLINDSDFEEDDEDYIKPTGNATDSEYAEADFITEIDDD